MEGEAKRFLGARIPPSGVSQHMRADKRMVLTWAEERP